jgi:outer membrane receptor protein involved in Fe transport
LQSDANGYFGRCLYLNGVNRDAQSPHCPVLTGHLGRADRSWHMLPTLMIYYTSAQGYRPGGFNRGAVALLPDVAGIAQYITPQAYGSDLLTNSEVGWKSELLNHYVMINGALYQDNWDNVQTSLFCPSCGFGNVSFGTNGPVSRVRGVALQRAAHLFTGFSLQGAVAWNSSALVNSAALIENNLASPNFGKPITTRYVQGAAQPVQNVYGARGSSLVYSPPFEADLRMRHAWMLGDDLPFEQVGFVHEGHTRSAAGCLATYNLPGWTTYDASMGGSKGDWTVTMDGSNLTGVNKSLAKSSSMFILTETPMRPRVISLTFHYD